MDIKRAFQVFDLDATSSPAAVKRRYYDLASVWHPDRYSGNSRLEKAASEKMKELNSAYETICLYLENHVIIACHHCGAENRKRADCTSDYATCRACGKQLRKPSPRKQKEPCGIHRCAGTIGANGRCDYCGKTVEEGRINSSAHPADPSAGELKTSSSRSTTPKAGLGGIAAFGLFAGGCVLLVLYAYHEITSKTPPRATHTESAIAGSAERIQAPRHSERRPFIFKTAYRPVIQDDSYYRALFDHRNINPEDAIRLQKTLITLGYPTGKTDGVIDKNTVLCLKQYSLDFGYTPEESFPDCFFRNSYFHHQIALEHKDWPVIFLAGNLEAWFDGQPDDYKKQIYELISEKPYAAVHVLRKYKFEKYKPLPILLPETGIITKNFSESSSHLRVKTKTESNNYYIKLFNIHDNQEILSAFIRSGSTLSARVPCGVYELRYAAGQNWYGSEYLFGTSTSYAKLHDPIRCHEKTTQAGGCTIGLVPIRHGHLTTAVISEFDF